MILSARHYEWYQRFNNEWRWLEESAFSCKKAVTMGAVGGRGIIRWMEKATNIVWGFLKERLTIYWLELVLWFPYCKGVSILKITSYWLSVWYSTQGCLKIFIPCPKVLSLYTFFCIHCYHSSSIHYLWLELPYNLYNWTFCFQRFS